MPYPGRPAPAGKTSLLKTFTPALIVTRSGDSSRVSF
jgi:hypothetical protein